MTPLRLSLLVGTCCAFSAFSPVVAAPEPSSVDAVAVVDGVPVSRETLNQTLEAIYGEQILPQLIDNQLLTNALKARGLSISDAEVNAELARVVQQNSEVQSAVAGGGGRVEIIKGQLRRNLTAQKLLTSRIPDPTPAQLQAFYAAYGFYYATPPQNKIGFLAASTKARADQLVKALKTNPGAFQTLVTQQKQKAATDAIGAQSTLDVGRFETPDEFATSRGIPPQIVAPLIKSLSTAKKGQILPMQALMPQGPFLIVKVVDHKDAIRPTLEQLKPEIETDYKLSQVAQGELKTNPRNPQLATAVKQVMVMLEQPNSQTAEPSGRPSLRDAFTFIVRPANDKSLAYLRSHSAVTFPDPSYSSVGKQYQKQP